jgi:hypothetical protein
MIVFMQERMDCLELGRVVIVRVGHHDVVDVAKPAAGIFKYLKEVEAWVNNDALSAMSQEIAASARRFSGARYGRRK